MRCNDAAPPRHLTCITHIAEKPWMSKIYLPTNGAADWRAFLAKPDLHWVRGKSARTIAHAWEAASGWPPEIAAILSAALGPTELCFAFPEHKTPLPGGSRDSQSDVFALGRHGTGLVACTIEGKVDEPFGPTISEQMRQFSKGKAERLAYLYAMLGLNDCPAHIHYQLLHRTVSALIEAEKFNCNDAAMIVHSFSPERRWFDAFANFVELFGQDATTGQPITLTMASGRRLHLGWACGDPRYLEK